MQHYAYDRKGRAVNDEALHGELKADLGDKFVGVSLDDAEVTLHFTAPLSPYQESEVQRVMDAHDGAVQTPEQLERLAAETAKEDFVKAPPADATKLTLTEIAARLVVVEELIKKLLS